MIRARCPICDAPVEGESLRELPEHPFCSARCRLIDLGRWLSGSYRIPEEQPSDLADEDFDALDPTPP